LNTPDSTGKAASAAYGGPGWSPRTGSMQDELGSLWAPCGVASEYAPLEAVLLHRPGPELAVDDVDAAQMLAPPDPTGAAAEHDAMADAYRANGVAVHYVEPDGAPLPNQMFVADLMFMTPAGAIVARPASTVRAGEERWVARRLAMLGVPILRGVGGSGVFEGADAMFIDPGTAVIGRGLRTNDEGARQVAATLEEQGLEVVVVDQPHGAMHLMGQFRIVDRDLAYVRAGRTPWRLIDVLRQRGLDVRFFPDDDEMDRGFAHNFVTLGPRRILMPAGNPVTEAEYLSAGIQCVTVEVTELRKAAGAVGCLTGVLRREPLAAAGAPAPPGGGHGGR
jgi:arginine deiminase